MLHKPTYIEEIERQVDQWNTELRNFRIIAEVADKDAQIIHYQKIEDITNKEKEVIKTLDKIKESTEVNWEHLATKIEEAKIKVNEAIEEARKIIN